MSLKLLEIPPDVDQEFLAKLGDFQRSMEKQGWRIPNHVNDVNKDVWIIEAGSTGVHNGFCDEQGWFWVVGDKDVYPSYPLLIQYRK